MQAKDAILTVYSFNEFALDSYLADMSDADLLVRPVEGQNHVAWQLGHVIAVEHGLLNSIKPGSSPPLPEGFAEAHGRDEVSTRSDDPARFCSKARYLELWNAQRAATKALLGALDAAALDVPSPERVRNRVPTVGDLFVVFGVHAMMHFGQFVSLRRKLGKPVVI